MATRKSTRARAARRKSSLSAEARKIGHRASRRKEEQPYTVMLKGYAPDRMVSVIKEVSDVTGLTLKDAKEAVMGAPIPLIGFSVLETAHSVVARLEAAGAKASVSGPDGQVQRRPVSRKPVPIITHQPGKGLVVSTIPAYPMSAGAKIVCAKSIVQAVVAAHDSTTLEGENYDITWPLEVVVALLEQASAQVET